MSKSMKANAKYFAFNEGVYDSSYGEEVVKYTKKVDRSNRDKKKSKGTMFADYYDYE